MPVGILSPTISASPIASRCFTSARSELPCAAISTRLPARTAGAIVAFQYGSTRATVSFRHSVRGTLTRADRALEHRGVRDVEVVAARFQRARGVARLLDAARREIDVGPAGEAVFPVPRRLAMAQEQELRHRAEL